MSTRDGFICSTLVSTCKFTWRNFVPFKALMEAHQFRFNQFNKAVLIHFAMFAPFKTIMSQRMF